VIVDGRVLWRAVTVRVHSSAALRCYLLAWNRALAAILDEPEELTAGTCGGCPQHRSGPAWPGSRRGPCADEHPPGQQPHQP